MRKLLIAVAAPSLLALGLANPAHADESFDTCPSGNSGIATPVTSCAFADSVRNQYFAEGGRTLLVVYSPVTGEQYEVRCDPAISHFNDGTSKTTVRCTGGNDAVVVFW
jgi:hypothetical protein